MLDIATVHCVILRDRMIPHAFMFIANLPVVSYDVYINAQMVIIMLNEIFLGLLMIINEYFMILLIIMILIVVNSLHRECYMLYGDEMVIYHAL